MAFFVASKVAVAVLDEGVNRNQMFVLQMKRNALLLRHVTICIIDFLASAIRTFIFNELERARRIRCARQGVTIVKKFKIS